MDSPEDQDLLQFLGGAANNNYKNIKNSKKPKKPKFSNTRPMNAIYNYNGNNRNLNNFIDMKENNNFDFSNTLLEMNKYYGNNVITQHIQLNHKNKNKYADQENTKNNTNIIKDNNQLTLTDFAYNGINNVEVYYFLVYDISKIIKRKFVFNYNEKIKVKDILVKISEQIYKEDINIEIFEKIISSPGYKIVLINTIGFFIKFLNNEDCDITYLLKNTFNDKKYVNYLCLYNLAKINTNIDIKKVVVINFIQNILLDLIKNKNEDIYANYSFEYIRVPAFIINEEINNMQSLINRIKDIYIEYFGKNAEKNKQFKIYAINKDIENVDILKIQFTELIEDNFVLYNQTEPNKTTYLNLLVGI